MERIKIIADSSSDLFELEGIDYEVAPLKIMTAEREFVDDINLDVLDMVEYLRNYKGRSSSSCPNTADWLDSFGDAKRIFCVTITATLSGSYNAAVNAKNIYEEQYPDRKVHVINSLSAGAELILTIQKIRDLALAGEEFEDICQKIEQYNKKTGLLFMLESMKNLANNGRVSPLIAKMAGILGIRVVGRASAQGDLEQLAKCRGEKKSLETIVEYLKQYGLKEGRVIINHCFNLDAANELKKLIKQKFEKVKVTIGECRGLCSFYAEKGGLMVGYEAI
ncbi:MAG: DegV family protein [Clostridia bacterium]|nr:DegV family protein [Clostridia bacterium]